MKKEAIVLKRALKARFAKAIRAKVVSFLVPTIGGVVVTGFVGWELWQAKKDSDAIKAKRAAAA